MNKNSAPEEHPSQERRSLHPDDDMLRSNGFKIWARPRRGQPQWIRKGIIFAEDVAVNICLNGRLGTQ